MYITNPHFIFTRMWTPKQFLTHYIHRACEIKHQETFHKVIIVLGKGFEF